MSKETTIGLVVPFATDKVPDEGLTMYPGVRFVAKGVGVRALTPEGYDAAFDGIVPAAQELARQGVDAIMVIGTSLTFYRGPEAHRELLVRLREVTGLPVSTMSEAVVEGLRSFGAKRVAVATAYADEVNRRLADFLRAEGFEVPVVEGFGITTFDSVAGSKTEDEIIELSGKAIAAAGQAEAVLISCGGLRTLNVADPIERRFGLPVVTSTQSAFWQAMRLVGADTRVPGHGRMLEQDAPVAT